MIIWIYIVYDNDWDIMEKKTYFLPLLYTIGTFLYGMISGKSFNPKKYFEQLYEKYINEEYIAFEYSDSEYNELVKMRDEIKKELDKNSSVCQIDG